MRRAAILLALAALASCEREQPLEAPDAKPGIVARGAPEDYAEPAAQAVRIEADLAEARAGETSLAGGAKAWRLEGALVKLTQPVIGGQRTAYFQDGRAFLIRQPDAAYAFHAGRPIYAYDGEGRPLEMTADARREAEVALAQIELSEAD